MMPLRYRLPPSYHGAINQIFDPHKLDCQSRKKRKREENCIKTGNGGNVINLYVKVFLLLSPCHASLVLPLICFIFCCVIIQY